MGRPRAFDWDEAKRLRTQGLSYAAVARMLGVSANAVAQACDPAFQLRQRAGRDRCIQELRHPCFGGCGVLVWGHSATASGYCRKCRGERRNVVRHGTESEYRQGCRCSLCTAASTEAQRRRRERTRVPCSHGCGTLVLAQRPDKTKPPECRPCFLRRMHAERRAAA